MSAPKSERNMGIDFFRGFFILTMCMDHFGHLLARAAGPGDAPFRLYSYNNIGWSTGAEFFVFFSGYVIATVYSRTLSGAGYWKTQLRATHRSWELYVRSAFIWVAAVALVYWLFAGDGPLLAATQIDRATAYPDGGIFAFMTLHYFPTYFEILPVYMVLMLFAPGFLWLQARLRYASIVLSALLWLVVQFHPQLNFYTDFGAWRMNPFAWQFVFFLGMWFAKEFQLTNFNREHRMRKAALAIGALVLCAGLKVMDKADVVLPFIGVLDIPYGKTEVAPVRLGHFLLMIYLIGILMPSNEWVKRSWLTHGVAQVGTHSLDCFTLSILLGYTTAGLFGVTAGGTLEYLALVAVNAFGIVLAAFWFTWLKTPPWRPPSGGSPKAPLPKPEPAAASWPASPLVSNQ